MLSLSELYQRVVGGAKPNATLVDLVKMAMFPVHVGDGDDSNRGDSDRGDSADPDGDDVGGSGGSADPEGFIVSMQSADLLADMVVSEAGSCKSMALNRFLPCLSIAVRRKLEKQYPRPEIQPEFLAEVGKTVAKYAIGRKGVPVTMTEAEQAENDLETDDVEDANDDALALFRNSLEQIKRSFANRKERNWKPLCVQEIKILDCLRGMILDEVRTMYLPPYLAPLVNEWKRKLSEKSYARIPLAWRLFWDIDTEDFVQHLCPQASAASSFVNFTTTRLAMAWSAFLSSQTEDNARRIAHTLTSWVDSNDIITAPKSSFCRGKANAKLKTDRHIWTQHPDVLWRFLFPGIFDTYRFGRHTHLKFLNFIGTNGIEVQGLFANTRTFTGTSKTTAKAKGYNSRSWKSRLDPGDQQISLATLVGDFPVVDGSPKVTVSCSDSFRGLIPIDAMVKNSTLRIGWEETKALFDNRVIFAVDPGVTNMITAVATLVRLESPKDPVSASVIKFSVSAKDYYEKAGVNDLKRNSSSAKLQADLKDLHSCHSCTVDPVDYQLHVEAFNKVAPELMERSHAPDALESKWQRRRREQRFMTNLTNLFLAHTEALHRKVYGDAEPLKKRPLIIYGSGTFGGMRGQRSVGSAKIRNFLSRFFPLIVIDEYMTSQKCPRCFSQLRSKGGSWSVKECTNRNCLANVRNLVTAFTVNRDFSAAMNMLQIVLAILLTGTRPSPFRRKEVFFFESKFH